MFALSLKQPWAALILSGRKTIEIRNWQTPHRGRLAIHASKQVDEREFAWTCVDDSVRQLTQIHGGVIGYVDLLSIRSYRTQEMFTQDQKFHLNHPDWYQSGLFGWIIDQPMVVPFFRVPGNVRLFQVPDMTEPITPTNRNQLLVSVRTAEEAILAIHAGADLLDIKEPANGSLGRATWEVIQHILEQVPTEIPVSIAMGEWQQFSEEFASILLPWQRVQYVKFGLSNLTGTAWVDRFLQFRQQLPLSTELVLVAYADDRLAKSPSLQELTQIACQHQFRTVLVDTFDKQAGHLVNSLPRRELKEFVQQLRRENIKVALAGSLNIDLIQDLLPLQPDWFAVRGAVCQAQKRDAKLEPEKIHRLKRLLAAETRLVEVAPPEYSANLFESVADTTD